MANLLAESPNSFFDLVRIMTAATITNGRNAGKVVASGGVSKLM
jgi:hypothetical protein